MHVLSLVAAVAVMGFLVGGCASRVAQPPTPPQTRPYVLVYLVAGERRGEWSDAERAAIQERHMGRIRELVDEGVLLVAGPFGRENHDPSVRGIFVFDVPSLPEAERLTSTDPAVEAGVLAMRLHRFETDADLRAAVAADLAAEAEAKREGRELRMQDRIRAYGLLRTAEARGCEAAGALLPEGDLAILTATVDGREGLCVIRTDDLPRLRERLSEGSASIGPYTLDEWWASAYLDRGMRGAQP